MGRRTRHAFITPKKTAPLIKVIRVLSTWRGMARVLLDCNHHVYLRSEAIGKRARCLDCKEGMKGVLNA